jgi:hypothetical protein
MRLELQRPTGDEQSRVDASIATTQLLRGSPIMADDQCLQQRLQSEREPLLAGAEDVTR